MLKDPFTTWYLVMLFFQTLYFLEEIRLENYRELGSLQNYLRLASFLIFLSYLPLLLIVQGLSWAYYLAFLPCLLSLGNGITNLGGYLKKKQSPGLMGIGISIGIFLTVSGALAFLQILLKL